MEGKVLFQEQEHELDEGDPVKGPDDIHEDEAELLDPEQQMAPGDMQKNASQDSTLEDALWCSPAKVEELESACDARTRCVYTTPISVSIQDDVPIPPLLPGLQ